MSAVPDLVCLSHLRWGFVFQRPNHLMTRASRERRTFYWEEPVFEGGAIPRVDAREVSPNLYVLVPTLPEHFDRGRVPAALRELLHAKLRELEVVDPILWFYTPMALAFADEVEARATVYDCMDELSSFQGADPGLREHEASLFRRSQVVFTGGESLYESKRKQHPRVHAFPSSVDREHFAKAREGLEEPEDQRDIPHPRVGYFGVIDERIDLNLVADLADASPDWHVVMVGPVVKISQDSLPKRSNLHYLGQKEYGSLPAYVGGWDVAIMPFALNDSTRYISPTKTLEYLAAGKPVVSTAIHDVVTPYGREGLVRIGSSATFVDEVRGALSEDPSARRAKADAFVARTSWDQTWGRMSQIIEELTQSDRSE